jgi:MoxR-like ATPase
MYTIEKAKIAIKNGIKGYLLKDEKGMYVMKEVNRIPFYLEGEPGIGKTEIVRQIADELGIGYVSFSLTHHTRNSLLGLPVIKNLDDENKYTSYTISEIIAKVWQAREQHREGILLLDEFTCMSESIVPAMLAFLQTKNIGNHVSDLFVYDSSSRSIGPRFNDIARGVFDFQDIGQIFVRPTTSE